MKRQRRKGDFAPGNQNQLVHGGESAVKSLQRGEPFKGLAAQEERQVTADLEAQGRAEMVREQAVRLHTASRLYWNAVQTAADAGDLDKLDGYVARFGWLAGASLRAWAQLREETQDHDTETLDALVVASEVIKDGKGN